ncbi:MAG: hypothetical protein ACJ75H_16310 [Thermoanaerobaculia bacterium]
MRIRALSIVCPALLLLALAFSLAGMRSPLPTGDEATHVMMVQSLWHDHDLSYEREDLERAARIWDGGPAGLTLFSGDGGKTLRYGRPLAYPLAALPFYALFGVRGIALLNMALFLAMAAAALWTDPDEPGPPPLLAAGFFLGSAAFAYAFRLEPEAFLMACAFFPVLLWRRSRAPWALAGAGILLGAALTSSPLLALLGIPILIDLAMEKRWRGLAALLVGGLLAAGLLAGMQRVGTGAWAASGGAQRQTFQTEFPFESPRGLWAGTLPEPGLGAPVAEGLRLLPRNLLYALAGRYTGLLPYFPFALLALFLFLAGPKDRPRALLLAGILLYVVLVLVLHPHDFTGGPGFLGSRYLAAVYPAFLFLPGPREARWSPAFAFLAVGLWTAVAVGGSLPRINPEAVLQLHAESPAFQRLPLELTLLAGERLPGFFTRAWGDAVWIVPRAGFFAEENHPHGVWVRGSTRSEVTVVSPKPIGRLAFTVYSLAAANELTLDSGADRLVVRFDTEGKRNGTPVDLALRPVARGLGFFPGRTRERFYRFTLEATAGQVPARIDPRSHDPRDLGVFLDFTGEGL